MTEHERSRDAGGAHPATAGGSGAPGAGGPIDAETVRHVARLARLRLEESEVERLAGELESILAHFAGLRGVELESDAGAAMELAPVTREDVPDADPLLRPPAELAPDWRDGLFVVPSLPALDASLARAAAEGPDPADAAAAGSDAAEDPPRAPEAGS